MIKLNNLVKEFKKEVSFTVKAERVEDVKRAEENGSYYFYIRIFLARVSNTFSSSASGYSGTDGGDQLDFDDIKYVIYKLDPTFPQPIRRSESPNTQFEIKIWTYGFFKVSATLFTKNGAVFTINDVPLSFRVEEEEIKKNGQNELTWN